MPDSVCPIFPLIQIRGSLLWHPPVPLKLLAWARAITPQLGKWETWKSVRLGASALEFSETEVSAQAHYYRFVAP
jgi:hypothetical protein